MGIADKPDRIRLNFSSLSARSIDRDADTIHGLSVVTKGEALGHGLWLDDDFLKSVAKAGNASKNGIRGRFTHPGLSGDGLGKFLGRARSFKVDGSKVVADFTFSKSAHNTPDGDLAGYIMDLAKDDPEALGVSIVFSQDLSKQEDFMAKHTKKGSFISPDEDNLKNYTHARLAALHASDFVDEPAANPDGLFSFVEGNEIPAVAEALLSFAFGVSQTEPEAALTGIHPQRARAFITDFMQRHGLSIVSAEQGRLDAEMVELAKQLQSQRRVYIDALKSLQDSLKRGI